MRVEVLLKRAFIELGYRIGVEEKVREVLYKVAGEITFEKYISGKKFVNPKTKNKVNFSSLPKEYQKHLREQFDKKIKEIKENKKKKVSEEPKEEIKEEIKKVEEEIKNKEEKFEKDEKHREKVVTEVVEKISSPEVKNELVEGIKKYVNAEDFKKFGDSLKELDVEGMKKSLPGVAVGTLKGVLAVVGGMVLLAGMGGAAKDMVLGSVEESMEEIEARRKEEIAWEHFEEMEEVIEEELENMEEGDEITEMFKEKFGAKKIVQFSTMERLEDGDLTRPDKYLRVVVEIVPEELLEGSVKDHVEEITDLKLVPPELRQKMLETELDFKSFYKEEVMPEVLENGEIRKDLQKSLVGRINEGVSVSQKILDVARENYMDEYGSSKELQDRYDEYDKKMDDLSKYDPMEEVREELSKIYDEELEGASKKESMKNILGKYETQLENFKDLKENNPEDYDSLPEEVKNKVKKLEESYLKHKETYMNTETYEKEVGEMMKGIKTLKSEVGSYIGVREDFYNESKNIMKKGSMKKFSKTEEKNIGMISELVLDKLKTNMGFLKYKN